jgi:hypothetical protein
MGTLLTIIIAIIAIWYFFHWGLPGILAGLVPAAESEDKAGCVIGLIIAGLFLLASLWMFGAI